jgi:DnaK suppressor protein
MTLASADVQGSSDPGRYGPLLAKVREELDEVEEAMKRVEDGSYGRCEGCGNTLSDEELDASPLARRCLSCR